MLHRIAIWVIVRLIDAYQFLVSPLLGECCRFAPNCSEYAREALRRHGIFRGSALAVWRVLRCNPYCQGGPDPVPPARTNTPRYDFKLGNLR